MVKRVVCFFKSSFYLVMACAVMLTSLFCFGSMNSSVMAFSCKGGNVSSYQCAPSVIDLVKNFFQSPFKNSDDVSRSPEYVYMGGFPIGITIENDGVVVIAKGTVTTSQGEVNTSNGSDIKAGDIITHIQENKISSTAEIAMYLQENYSGVGALELTLNRGAAQIKTHIYPAFDMISNKYRLGLWVRDTATGVGTMTFIKENGEFSALGHPISDIDTSSKIDVKQGNIYKCNVIGVQKGAVGSPGELRGLFLKNGSTIGTIEKNTNFGIRGKISEELISKMNLTKYKVGRKGLVKTGKAKIISTVDGVVPEEFDIEIVKTSVQNVADSKSMVIHVTDKNLLERTGGIVQGMSGSPIIQDGKIVGAVTHVFINDPTRGYGLYMDWMLD